jgi:hypothetical protein
MQYTALSKPPQNCDKLRCVPATQNHTIYGLLLAEHSQSCPTNSLKANKAHRKKQATSTPYLPHKRHPIFLIY